ncbi:MAG: pyrroline-5-carboxylate reductase [Thermodesulfovibrionales bacterium]|nr:pyrroline-5-carboxylate reductase [Thermodesulfovibrionales bacterium]
MIAFIGGGNMAEALISGMKQAGSKEEVIVSEPRQERCRELERLYGVTCATGNADAAKKAGIIVLAVKPQQMDEVVAEIAPHVDGKKTIVSIAAGITIQYYVDRLKTDRVVRVMPNMGALKGESMSVLSFCDCFGDADTNRVKEIFMSSGVAICLPEKHMDAVTALSGSGPAFIALFIECMIEAGVSLGLSRDDATVLALQTLRGTTEVLDGGPAPGKLIEMVRSPGGTTAEGLSTFEDKDLAGVVRAALEAAARRSKELAK